MNKFSFYMKLFLKKWINIRKRFKVLFFFLLLILFLIIARLVYLTGGTQYGYLHAIYIPLMLSVVIFRLKGGIIGAIFAGLLLGPIMPLNVMTGEMQEPINWLIRMGFFILVGIIAGLTFEILSAQFISLEKQAFYDSITGLPNKLKLQEEVEELIMLEELKYFSLILINIENFSEIINNIGHNKAEDFLKMVAIELEERIDMDSSVYNIYDNKFAFLAKEKKDRKLIY